jgi:carboxyl-terminal processing protease
MDNDTRNTIKFVLASAVLLILLSATFLAGFGSAYLLTGSGALPTWLTPAPVAAPTATLPTELPTEERPATTQTPLPTPANEDEATFQLFWEVWGLVQDNYYGELPSMQEVTYAAIQGMMSALGDDYSAFFEPQAAAIMQEDATGEFQGIGAFVDLDEEGIVIVVGVFENSPAEEAGILADDRIVEVDDVSIVGLTLYEAIHLIRGPAGSEVRLLIEREGVEPFEVTVTRARLEIPVTEAEMRDDGIGYLRLYDFSAATASQRMESDLEELLSHNPRGIVFDLRGNPGGLLDQSLDIADLFIADGTIATERWNGGEEVFEAHPGDIGEDVPLVVLVDGGSASASEIVAGALQDHERAMLIGETTFGKGVVQRVFMLSDGSELWVTAARWFTPNDRAIHGQGLTPDIVVPWPEDVQEGVDPQLDRAVEYLLTGE